MGFFDYFKSNRGYSEKLTEKLREKIYYDFTLTITGSHANEILKERERTNQMEPSSEYSPINAQPLINAYWEATKKICLEYNISEKELVKIIAEGDDNNWPRFYMPYKTE
jgi:hypothetical protein